MEGQQTVSKSADPTVLAAQVADLAYSPTERELLADVLHALRGLRYGTVTLTVHEGRLVEIQKTERIRRGAHKPMILNFQQ